MTKICKECKLNKDINSFYKHKRCVLGVVPTCKECMQKKDRLRWKNDSIYRKGKYVMNEKWRKDNSEISNKSKRKWQRNNKEVRQNSYLRLNYGISLQDYVSILEYQKNKCCICGSLESKTKQTSKLSIDHNHKTLKIRGILCHLCNMGLGLLRVDEGVTNIVNAIRYINSNLNKPIKSIKEPIKRGSITTSERILKNKVNKYYGLSLADYYALIRQQKNICTICGNRVNGTLCVDHNHETNILRGFLCTSCNSGIGCLGVDTLGTLLLDNSLKYLKRPPAELILSKKDVK